MTQWVLQAPGETRAHEVDWVLAMETGEDVENSAWSIAPDLGPDTGAGISGELLETDAMVTKVTVSGLSAGQSYQLKNTITTSEGRILTREIVIRCANK